jgi:hypothetical protein
MVVIGVLMLGGMAVAAGPTSVSAGRMAETAPADKRVSLFGVEGSGEKIVYIVDHSGSMLDVFDAAQAGLRKSIAQLGGRQSFTVIMVSEKAEAIYPRLRAATAEAVHQARSRLYGFRAVGSNGNSVSAQVNAFRQAMEIKADMIYLLSDCEFCEELDTAVSKLRINPAVPIHTIALLDGRPVEEELVRQKELQAIADRSQGKHRSIDVDEVRRTQRLVIVIDIVDGEAVETLRREGLRTALRGRETKDGSLEIIVAGERARVLGDGKLGLEERGIKRAEEMIDRLAGRKAQGNRHAARADALEKAFSIEADTILFATSGEVDQQLRERIRTLNSGKNVSVHVVGLLEQNAATVEVVRGIARENDGEWDLVGRPRAGK